MNMPLLKIYRGGAYNELRLFDIVLSDICGYDLCFTNK